MLDGNRLGSPFETQTILSLVRVGPCKPGDYRLPLGVMDRRLEASVSSTLRADSRNKGGHEGELDVVAFHPGKTCLVHIETSMDATSWKERETKFSRKFKTGQKHIRSLFEGFDPLPEIQPVALIVMGSAKNHAEIGGGTVVMIGDFMREMRDKIQYGVGTQIVPEQYVILRTLQFAKEYWSAKEATKSLSA